MTILFVKVDGDQDETVPLFSSHQSDENQKHAVEDFPRKNRTLQIFPTSLSFSIDLKLLCSLSISLVILVTGLVFHYFLLCDVCNSSSLFQNVLPPVLDRENVLPPIPDRENVLPPILGREEIPPPPPPQAAETGREREAASGSPALTLCRNRDVENGRWIRTAESEAPLTPKEGDPTSYDTSCPFVLSSMACVKNGRSPDFLNWEWQPHGCQLPPFDAAEFGRVMANRTLLMAGDSLMDSNFAPALLCAMHRHSPVEQQDLSGGATHETTDAPPQWLGLRNLKAFHWKRFNTWLLVSRSPFLTRMAVPPGASGSSRGNLDVYLDEADTWTQLLPQVDVLVMNSGVWWGGPRSHRGYYKRGRLLNSSEIDRRQAYGAMLDTVTKTLRGPKAWPGLPIFLPNLGRGGHYCNISDPLAPEEVPSFGVSNPTEAHFLWRTRRATDALPRFPVLGVELLTRLRRDAHPGTFHQLNASEATWHDCLHWCTPGVPDTWVRVLLTTIKEYMT